LARRGCRNERLMDRGHDAVDLVEDFVVPESKNPIPASVEEFCSPRIRGDLLILAMSAAITFDH
jgi:hypothetical protein